MKTHFKTLIGCGDKIGLLILPALIAGLALNITFPAFFDVGGPKEILMAISIIVLIPGMMVWIWSVALILVKVPRKELITSGPYAIVKHPLYVGVAFLVIPWVGFLLNSWLGVVIGILLYTGSRLFAPGEEKDLSRAYGTRWNEYINRVKLPWL
jgi:protein-S-isoprenylcysteine O-methyltransferase Ste14